MTYQSNCDVQATHALIIITRAAYKNPRPTHNNNELPGQ